MMRKYIALTGIPKSGTTYLCSILHNFSNVVMLSEPPMLDMMHKPMNEGPKDIFDHWYEKVLNREEVPNKLAADGSLVKDYRTEKWVKPSTVHDFDNEDFIFGIKNPRMFLDRLPGIVDGMPNAQKIVIVRNPYDTVGSFRRFQGGMTFGSRMHKFRDFYKDWLNMDLVEHEKHPVLVWKFWSSLIIKCLDNITLVRYQDAVLRPQQTITRVFGSWTLPGRKTKEILPSQIRYSSEHMIEGDSEMVEKHCKENAKILGVW